MQGEEWRNVLDPTTGAEVPGRMISSFGRVMLKNGFVYHGTLTRAGYFATKLSTSRGISTVQFVHRIVAAAFLGLAPAVGRTFVNHKDGDKGNNAAENLEYVTHAENISHRFALARSASTLAKPVWCKACGSKDAWRWFASMNEAAEALGLHSQAVSACTRGLQKQSGGYEFRLASQPKNNDTLPGEEWRPIDLPLLLEDRETRRKAL